MSPNPGLEFSFLREAFTLQLEADTDSQLWRWKTLAVFSGRTPLRPGEGGTSDGKCSLCQRIKTPLPSPAWGWAGDGWPTGPKAVVPPAFLML